MRPTFGVIGVGTIAAATIRGLRAAWPDLRMVLSPRSEATSRALSEGDPLIHRAESNAAVVEASDVVLLSVLPTQVDAVVRNLPFRAQQTVVSCIAGAPLSEVAELASPARVCRLVPLPMIERREGPIVLYPAVTEIEGLFAGSGDIIVPKDEDDFATYAGGSAMMSSFFALEDAIAGWMATRGAIRSDAETYVRSLFRALAESGVRSSLGGPEMIAAHETPGGLNARVRAALEFRDWFAAPGNAFTDILRLRRMDLGT